MKLTAISDTHGLLPEIKTTDLLCICGDISPLDIQFNKPEMTKWLYNQFIPWVKEVDAEKVLLVAGNHDAWFEGASHVQIHELEYQTQFKLKYLENELYTYMHWKTGTYTIYGTPYCHVFGNWPFMRTEETLVNKFAEIPDKVNIILSHDTPYGVGEQDLVLETVRWSNHELEHVGNKPLANRLSEIKYDWLLHGHIHSSSHTPDEFGTGKVVNVSIVDESYTENFEPFVLEI